MAFSKEELVALYRRRARRYDVSANLYYLIGFRESLYRRRAVAALQLREGDTVVEVGCGTGLNFPLLRRVVGPTGKIIGVDFTGPMLEQAANRVASRGWENVELVLRDAASFPFPEAVNGVLSSFAITLVPEYERVIANGWSALAEDGRFAILDLKKPQARPLWLIRPMVALTRPFGVTLDIADRRPWEALQRHSAEWLFEEFYFGFAYLAVGAKSGSGGRHARVRGVARG